MCLGSKQMIGLETLQTNDLAWMWIRPPHRNAPRLQSDLFFFYLLMVDDLSHWLQLTCLWGHPYIWCIIQTSWWWMQRSSSPSRCLCSTAGMNDKLHTWLSLFNEHQVTSVWCVCLCVQGSDGENAKKMLFVIIWVLQFIVPIHVSIATHTTETHTHLTFAHILPAMYWADAALFCFIALSPSVLPSPVPQDRDPSCHRHPYE